MKETGAVPVLGCTELPIAQKKYHLQGEYINPSYVLAYLPLFTESKPFMLLNFDFVSNFLGSDQPGSVLLFNESDAPDAGSASGKR